MSMAMLSTLEQADFTTEQARAITKVFEEDHQNLATKEDIRYLGSRMSTDIKSLESKMTTKDEINKIDNDMINWIVAGIFRFYMNSVDD